MADKTTLKELIEYHFGVDETVFLDALLSSGNARGYIGGAISEHVLKQELMGMGFELARIREKWVGPKLHHGDFYIRRAGSSDWFVLESKGVKSNSEKWHKLRTVPTDPKALEKALSRRRGEWGDWWKAIPGARRRAILESRSLCRGKMIETHFVSGTAGRSGRTIATPRKTEFHIVSLDLFLRTRKHEFVYAATEDLSSPDGNPDHLKQNYLIDIVVPGVDVEPTIREPWTRDFNSVFNRLKAPVKDSDRQLDLRLPGARELGVDDPE